VPGGPSAPDAPDPGVTDDVTIALDAQGRSTDLADDAGNLGLAAGADLQGETRDDLAATGDHGQPAADTDAGPVAFDALDPAVVAQAADTGDSVAIAGTVTGAFSEGDQVSINVNGVDHQGTVDAQGQFSIQVPGADLHADGAARLEGAWTTTDAEGNAQTHEFSQDLGTLFSADGTATVSDEAGQAQPIGLPDDTPAAEPAPETPPPLDDGASLLADADSHAAPADQTPAPAAETPAPESSPLQEYLAFADLSAAPVGHGGAGIDAQSPVSDYLDAAGIAPDTVTQETPALPPTELMVEPAEGAAGPDTDGQTHDAAVEVIPLDVPDAPQHEDPQHYHGV
jgi:hypothetical protein